MAHVPPSDAARFAGQLALITGAGSGIGRATALLWARQGGTAIVADLDAAGIDGTLEAIRSEGGTAIGHSFDVTSESGWADAIALTERTGRLHTLVNCAGIALVKPVAETELADWKRVLSVNLDGVFLGTREAIRSMRRTGGGSIVNVSSVSGIKAAPTASAYCASKAAVILFTKTAAMECVQAGDGIRINAVAPGGVKTPLWAKTEGASGVVGSDQWNAAPDGPIGKRFAEAEEVASAILFLASAESSYVTGSVLTVDAGYTA